MLALADFIAAPYNPRVNFNLALEYDGRGQTAAAASFYLRAAEKTNNPTLQYIALIRNALYTFKSISKISLKIFESMKNISNLIR